MAPCPLPSSVVADIDIEPAARFTMHDLRAEHFQLDRIAGTLHPKVQPPVPVCRSALKEKVSWLKLPPGPLQRRTGAQVKTFIFRQPFHQFVQTLCPGAAFFAKCGINGGVHILKPEACPVVQERVDSC